MYERLLWLLLALVHTGPALALVRPSLLSLLHGIGPGDPAFLLVQHRAALFLCICVMCLWAAFDPGVRRLAVVATAVSMLSFLVLYRLAGDPPHLHAIAITDFVALPVLAASAYLAWR